VKLTEIRKSGGVGFYTKGGGSLQIINSEYGDVLGAGTCVAGCFIGCDLFGEEYHLIGSVIGLAGGLALGEFVIKPLLPN